MLRNSLLSVRCVGLGLALLLFGRGEASAQNTLLALSEQGGGAVHVSPLLSFTDIEQGNFQPILEDLLGGEPAPTDLDFRIFALCHDVSDTNGDETRCRTGYERFVDALRDVPFGDRRVDRFFDRMVFQVVDDGLPDEDMVFQGELQGFRFLVRFAGRRVSEDLPGPPVSDPAEDALLAGVRAAPAGDVILSDVLGFEAVGAGRGARFVEALIDGPVAANDRRYTTQVFCFQKTEGVTERDECNARGEDLRRAILSIPNDGDRVRKLSEGLSFHRLTSGLPDDSLQLRSDIEGFRFIIRLAPRLLPPRPTVDTAAPAYAPAQTERVILHPDLAPPGLVMAEADRAPPKGLAMDFWMSADWFGQRKVPPTLLSLQGEQGPVFAVHIMPDRSGLAVSDGSGTVVYSMDRRFQRGHLYRISLQSTFGKTTLYVDGEWAGEVGVGFIPGDTIRSLQVGALSDGSWPFEGTFGRLRLWGASLDFIFAREVAQETDPERPLPQAVRLILTADATGHALDFNEAPAYRTPTDGWWRQATQTETRIHNLEAFIKGGEPPNLSPLHEALDGYHNNEAVYGPAARAALSQLVSSAVQGDDNQIEHGQFSIHPLYRLIADDGLDASKYQLTDEHGEWVQPDRRPLPTGRVSGLLMTQFEDRLTWIGIIACDKPDDLERENWFPYRPLMTSSQQDLPAQEPFRVQCDLPRERRRQDYVWFADDEEIRGLTWRVMDEGKIAALEIHTNRQTYGPFANGPQARAKINRFTPVRSIWMDRGVGFYGLQGKSTDAFTGLAFIAPPRLEEPGVTLIAENGDALRFVQENPNFWRGSDARQLVAPFDNPTMQINPGGSIQVTAIDPTPDWAFGTKAITLERIEDPDAVTPNDTYNNTFVALSKAVNLQASYTGYDLLQMDPIHLTRTGASGMVFRQPQGRSKDYYDFNRIFVPRGLNFVPEFTGDIHKETHETTTYQEFKDAVSSSVSVGLKSKALPSFSLSSTMKEAEQTISEQKKIRSIGFSRAYFYDLILDKSAIELDDNFRQRIARLVQHQDFQSFIETYGTHYAVGVIYGGAGVLTVDTDERTRGTLLEKGIDTKTEVGLVLDAKTETALNFGTEHAEETARQFRDVVGSSNENFYWIGGAHVGLGAESWSVGTDGVVPVHVVLRPIDELLSSVFFSDPEISLRVRHQLRSAIGDYIASHDGIEPRPSAPLRQGYLEVRFDHLYCGETPPDENWATWGTLKIEEEENVAYMDYPSRQGQSLQPQAHATYPLISVSAYDRNGHLLLDHAAPAELPKDEDGKALKPMAIQVLCNSFDDILPKSQHLQANAMARFAMSAEDILWGGNVEFINRRDREFRVLHRHVSDDMTTKDALLDGALDGATLGLKILWDEYVTGKGSKLVDAIKQAEKPEERPSGLSKWSPALWLLCAAGENCGPTTPAELDGIAGQWFQHTLTMEPPAENCADCVDHILHYSVRYLQ
ncbi:MAC/perforin domain-containing protein [Thiocapsa bogorovii]|uniref:MAC/perforin domain-containing protein n=1 Tax=Thiocapsa bogorovii TaxID=521689 RepID=UPI001E29AD4A|nr:MAC/perforin domain-containing protein [Thiocapsa bogorovii]UHD14768.1 MAC/perforin domain-containing protein [Thiocapsa bogorovii]